MLLPFCLPQCYSSLLILLSSVLLTVFSQQEGDIRLAGYGASRLAGRVEIYLNQQWVTVRDDSAFNAVAAQVVCRQLRLGHAVGFHGTPSLRYGIGNGTVCLEGVRCCDDDLHLLRCRHNELDTNSSCDHLKDASVACSGISTPHEGEVRLVGGAYASSGTVELYLHRHWAPVCSISMEPELADTICRQLGYTGAKAVANVTTHKGPFWNLVSPACSNRSEPCIRHCYPNLTSSLWSESCDSGGVAWDIQCEIEVWEFGNETGGSYDLCALNITQPEEGEVRLHGDDPEQGRVEVYVGGVWSSLCKSSLFGIQEAAVVCKQRGFPTALLYKTVLQVSLPEVLPELPGPQYMARCTGLESYITNCTLTSMAEPNHDDDAYIHCSSILWPFGSLQLVGGAGSFGQLQVSTDNQFYWLCDANFGPREADVACRQLGYHGTIRVVHNSLLYDEDLSSSVQLPFSLQCSGEEDQLLSCTRLSSSTGICRDGLDAVAIQCESSNSSEGWGVRLVPGDDVGGASGDSVRVGRVEVEIGGNGDWGTVCGDKFSNVSAHVICRQLGFDTFDTVYIGSNPGSKGQPVAVSSVRCTGFEERLEYCPHVLAEPNCTHDLDISINCSGKIPHIDGSLRLVNSTHDHAPQSHTDHAHQISEGRLEVSFHGIWMSVCGVLFSHSAADVACRRLGFGLAGNFCTDSCFGSGSGYVHFAEYICPEGANSLLECSISIHDAESCDLDSHVGLSCVALPPPSSTSPSPSRSLPSSLPPIASSPVTITLHTSQLSPLPTIEEASPSEENNSFWKEGVFYIIIFVLCVLVLALVIAVAACYIYKQRRAADLLGLSRNFVAQQNNHSSINPGASTISGEGEEVDRTPSEFDFDEVANSIEMKVSAKAAEAAAEAACLPPTKEDCISLSSAGPPPNYDELDFLSHSLPEKSLSLSQDS